MPRWKKLALLAAVGAIVTGAVLSAVADPAPPTGTSGLQASLVQGSGAPTGQTAAAPVESPAKGVFRLGFSFVAGFCLGSFLRATLRVASIAIGFWLAMTVTLSYFGLVTVDWPAIENLWNRFITNVEAEWGNFQTFLTGSLPAAGLATLGLAAGLKRH